MVFRLITVIIPFFHVLVTGSVTWNMTKKPVVFGTDIQLNCNLPMDPSCCQKYRRKWNVGFNYTVVVVNGLSLNKAKYTEELNEIQHVSMLTIKSLDETDVNKPYECVYGFWKFRATLALDKDIFEFHPSNMLPVTPVIDGYNVTLTVIFKKVFPVPICSAKLGVKNISSFLNVNNTPNGILYKSVIKLEYSTNDEECKGSLFVNCKVGQKDFRIVDTQQVRSNIQGNLSMGGIVGIVIAVLVLVVLAIVLIPKMKLVSRYRRQADALQHADEEMPWRMVHVVDDSPHLSSSCQSAFKALHVVDDID